MEHLSDILIACAAAGFGALGNWLFIRHRHRNDDNLSEYAARMIRDESLELRQRINLVESYNAEQVQRNGVLERENYELKMKNEILQAFPFNIPLPMWSVDIAHRYDYVNEMYARVFLKQFGLDHTDAIGKNLFEVWPREFAEMFRANNQRVMDEDLIMNDIEEVPDSLGHPVKWRILKMRRPYPVGVIGIAIPVNGMFDKMLRKIQK